MCMKNVLGIGFLPEKLKRETVLSVGPCSYSEILSDGKQNKSVVALLGPSLKDNRNWFSLNQDLMVLS